MKKNIFLTVVVLAAMIFATSCATTVTTTFQRPAELDLNGAESVGILPFQPENSSYSNTSSGSVVIVIDLFHTDTRAVSEESRTRQDLAELLTDKLWMELAESSYLKLVNATAIEQALANGLPAPCDAYITGTITKFDTTVISEEKSQTINGQTQKYTAWHREARAVVVYHIIDAATNRVISYKTATFDRSSTPVRKVEEIISAYQLLEDDFRGLADSIMKQIQPYSEKKTLYLLDEDYDDPDMKYADELVKSGVLGQAYNLYYQLYVNKGYMEAGYNAAILLEAAHDLEGARDLMQEVYDIFYDKNAKSALTDISKEIEKAGILDYQNSIRGN